MPWIENLMINKVPKSAKILCSFMINLCSRFGPEATNFASFPDPELGHVAHGIADLSGCTMS